jgi:hypothetical protein
MGADLQILVENPVLPIVLLFLGALIGIQIERIATRSRRKRYGARRLAISK